VKKTNKADVGWPGSEKTGFPSITAKVVGFPGFIDIPQKSMPGLPSLAKTFGMRSLGPTDTPPEVMTASAAF